MKALALHDLLDRRRATTGMHIGVEHPLPHRHEPYHMTLLPRVLLCSLHFHGHVGVPQCGEEWRDGLARLKVDRTVLDLNNDIGFELAIEIGEIVITCSRTIRL